MSGGFVRRNVGSPKAIIGCFPELAEDGDVRFGSFPALRHPISSVAAIGCIADTHASATFLVIVDDCSASRPDIGFIRLASHNLSGVVNYETERIGNYVYRGKQ